MQRKKVKEGPPPKSLDEPTDTGEACTIADTLVAETLLSDFDIRINLDELFPDRVRNHIAKNLEEESPILAERFNLSPSRIRELRQEVRDVIRDELEAGYFWGVYLPGPADEIKRCLALLYRKPRYKWPEPKEEKEKSKKVEKVADTF